MSAKFIRLSAAQNTALLLLGIKPRQAAKSTTRGAISGICASTLLRLRFVRRLSAAERARWVLGTNRHYYAITLSGTAALAAGGYYKKKGAVIAIAPPIKEQHVGMAPYRFKENPDERRFAEAWARINRDERGTLALLLDPNSGMKGRPPALTPREMLVAATVVQWFGSPNGQCFLRDLGFPKKERK
jgi:hypothetical protein